jgi:peptidoglycan hydrolase CwlO-like protein
MPDAGWDTEDGAALRNELRELKDLVTNLQADIAKLREEVSQLKNRIEHTELMRRQSR